MPHDFIYAGAPDEWSTNNGFYYEPYFGRYCINYNDMAILLGLIIGDGSIPKSGSVLHITHGIKQEVYLTYKLELLKTIINTSARILYSRNKTRVEFSAGCCAFKYIRAWLYDDNVKVITSDVLQYLTAQSLALWYMDDGSVSIKSGSNHAVLWMYKPLAEVEKISEWLYAKYAVYGSPQLHQGSYSLRFATLHTDLFFDLIQPYVPPAMEYKLGTRSQNIGSNAVYETPLPRR